MLSKFMISITTIYHIEPSVNRDFLFPSSHQWRQQKTNHHSSSNHNNNNNNNNNNNGSSSSNNNNNNSRTISSTKPPRVAHLLLLLLLLLLALPLLLLLIILLTHWSPTTIKSHNGVKPSLIFSPGTFAKPTPITAMTRSMMPQPWFFKCIAPLSLNGKYPPWN